MNIAVITIIALLHIISILWYAGLIQEVGAENEKEYQRLGGVGRLFGPRALDAVIYVLSGGYKSATENQRILKDFSILRALFAVQVVLIIFLVIYNVVAT